MSQRDYTIPPTELSQYRSKEFTDAQRTEVWHWLELLGKLSRLGGVRKAAELARSLPGEGYSVATIRRKWYAYQRSGWSALINGAKSPKSNAIPLDFRTEFKGLVDKHHNAAKAVRVFYQQWANGHKFEGIGTWQDWYQRCYGRQPDIQRLCPWSASHPAPRLHERNLRALGRRSKVDLMLDQGQAGAYLALPGVALALDTMPILGEVHIDDAEWPWMIYDFASGQVVKLKMVAACDARTRKILAYILVPAVENEKGVKRGIAAIHIRALIGKVLRDVGFPVGWHCTFVCENATAAICAEVEQDMKILTGGRVFVRRTTLLGGRELNNFVDANKGNPRAKLIEGLWNWTWNELCGEVDGARGKNYIAKPAEAEARFAWAAKLLKAGQGLAPHQVEDLMQGTLHSTQQAMRILDAVWERHANNTNHRMRGGFLPVRMWRYRETPDWFINRPLPNVPMEHLQALIESKVEVESPNMAAARLITEAGPDAFRRLDAAGVAHLLSDTRYGKYQGTGFMATAWKTEAGKYIDHHYNVSELDLEPGQKYMIKVDPARRGSIFILSEDGQRCFGEAMERTMVTDGDVASLRRAQEEQMTIANHAIKEREKRKRITTITQRTAHLASIPEQLESAAERVQISALELPAPDALGQPRFTAPKQAKVPTQKATKANLDALADLY
jgi:hypothetical protein